MAYIDTSALVGLYLPEVKSSRIQQVVRNGHSVCISPLVEVELASAISRKVRTRELSTNDAQKVISLFQKHLKTDVYTVYPIWQREYDLAREWIGACTTPLRTLDAIHLAVAFYNEEVLVTTDEKLSAACSALGIEQIFI